MSRRKHKVEFNLSLTGLAAVEKGFTKLKGTLSGLTGFASKFTLGLTGLGGALTAGGFLAGIKNAADLGGSLSDVAARTDMAAGEVMLLQQVFKNAGIDASALQQSMAYLSRSIASAKDGNDAMVKTFAKLGLTWEQLYAMRPADRFRAVSAAIGGLKNTVDKTDVSMSLFSRSGAQLLNISSTDFSDAERVLGGLPAIMEKSAESFDKISDAIGNLPVKSQQFFAGFLSQVDVSISSMLTSLESLDLTGFGELVGGKFRDAFAKFADGDIWGGMTSGMKTIWEGFKTGFEIVTDLANAAFLDIDLQPFFKVLSAGFAELAIEFPKLFWTQFYKIGETLGEKAAQASLEMLSVAEIKQLQRTIARTEQRIALIKSGRVVGREAARLPEYETELARAKRRLPIATEELQQLYKLGAEAERARSEEFSKAILGAVSQPKSNLAAVWEATQKRLGIGVTPPLTSPPVSETSTAELDASYYDWQRRIEELNRDILDSQKQLNALRVQDVALATELEAVMHQTRLTDANFSLTELQKYQEKKTLLTEESKKHEEQIILLTRQNTELGKQLTAKKELFELLADPEQEAAYEREIAMLERSIELNNNAIERIRNYSELSAFALGPEMTSFSAQIEQALIGLQNAWGSLAIQSANVFRRMADSATSTLGNAFTGLILQTKTLGQAFQEMGRMLLESMVSAIAEVFARWLVLKASMATFSIGGGGGFLGGIFGFAEGGRIPAGERLVRVNEEGSEYVVSARSPRVNDSWLDYANQGGRLADFAAAQGTVTSAPSSSKTVIVRSQSEIRREWKESGLIDYVKDGFSKRGLGYA